MFINFYSNIDHCSKTQLNLARRHEGFFMAVQKLDTGKWI